MAAPNPHAPDLIEDYLEDREPFARPILHRLRAMIHQAHPEIVEDWKWGGPIFCLHGRNVVLLGGFKKHVSLIFCEGARLEDWAGLFDTEKAGDFIRVLRLRAEKDIDAGVLFDYLAQACAFAEAGPLPAAEKKGKPIREVIVPEILARALRKEKPVAVFFESLTPSCRREYCQWIAEAKQEATRERRLAKTLAFLRAEKKRPFG